MSRACSASFSSQGSQKPKRDRRGRQRTIAKTSAHAQGGTRPSSSRSRATDPLSGSGRVGAGAGAAVGTRGWLPPWTTGGGRRAPVPALPPARGGPPPPPTPPRPPRPPMPPAPPVPVAPPVPPVPAPPVPLPPVPLAPPALPPPPPVPPPVPPLPPPLPPVPVVLVPPKSPHDVEPAENERPLSHLLPAYGSQNGATDEQSSLDVQAP